MLMQANFRGWTEFWPKKIEYWPKLPNLKEKQVDPKKKGKSTVFFRRGKRSILSGSKNGQKDSRMGGSQIIYIDNPLNYKGFSQSGQKFSLIGQKVGRMFP
jgi:hypothetical protein